MSVIDVHALANDSNENHSVITNKNEKIDIDNLPLILKIEDAGKVAGLNDIVRITLLKMAACRQYELVVENGYRLRSGWRF
jgi:hypothetical protein